MPSNGFGVYTLPAGSLVTDGTYDILTSQHNTPLTDLQPDMNTPRPLESGGTAETSATTARTSLGIAMCMA